MTVRGWADTTGLAAGDVLRVRVESDGGAVGVWDVGVWDTVREERVLTAEVTGPDWELTVPRHWPSSLYCLVLGSAQRPPGRVDNAPDEVYVAVRPPRGTPPAPVLVPVPFLTWQAYNRLGVPGEGLYLTEQPDRATRVGFDRPGGGPAGFWEEPFYRWLHRSGVRADYCSEIDLHTGAVDLAAHRLLICAGHHEYWTWEQRDRVEQHVRDGGNVAFFGGNTCWWQVRLEDGGRTLVCHRDAPRDPVAAADPSRTTTQWSSAPVDRPENALTGVSFRHGAGCWLDMDQVATTSYTTRFAGHWVFEGTGLRDGEEFATGAVGYETDAALYEEVDGVPRATGADGTPPGFVVLATADLRHWRDLGQGGRATLGLFTRGRGSVFTASTVSWAQRLDDPVVDRITRTVVERLSAPPGPPVWDDIGPAADVVALAVCEEQLYAVDAAGTLLTRGWGPQNLPWRALGPTPGVRALTAPREALGRGVELVGLLDDGRIAVRGPGTGPAPWRVVAEAPAGAVDLVVCFDALHVLTKDGGLHRLALDRLDGGARGPDRADPAVVGVFATAASGGHLLALHGEPGGPARLSGRVPAGPDVPWDDLGDAAGCTALAVHAGRAVAVRDGRLVWRSLI